MNELIAIERRGSAALLTLNQPESSNPLDRATAEALHDALIAQFADDAVRSLAITGAGASFCAGGDLRQMRQLSDLPVTEALEWPSAIIDLHRLMLSAPKPVIAAVNGPAVAGGMGLAGMCDIVLATAEAWFAMPEARIGLFPMIIVAQLVRALPRKVMLEMMFTGDSIDAQEAHRVGFVSQVYADAPSMMKGIDAYAQKFAKTSPQAIRLGRRAFQLLAGMPELQALEAAQMFNLPFLLGTDFQEGTRAFFEKRDPKWDT